MAAGVLEAAFAEIDRQLEAKGLILKKGTLLDATARLPRWQEKRNRLIARQRSYSSFETSMFRKREGPHRL